MARHRLLQPTSSICIARCDEMKPRLLLVTAACPATHIVMLMELAQVAVIDIRRDKPAFRNEFYDIEIVEMHVDDEQWKCWQDSLAGRPAPSIRIHSCLENEAGMRICIAEVEDYLKRRSK